MPGQKIPECYGKADDTLVVGAQEVIGRQIDVDSFGMEPSGDADILVDCGAFEAGVKQSE